MAIEPHERSSSPWAEPKYPTDEEIAELPDYVHPATRWSLAFISFIAGCVASATAVMRLVGGANAEIGPDGQPVQLVSDTAAWCSLMSGLCWMMAAVTVSRGDLKGTAIWFFLGIASGVLVTIL
jgi:hypothetical protein